jgi:hypothetical protein
MLDVQGAGVQAAEHDGDHQDAEHGERGAQRGERFPPRPHQLRYTLNRVVKHQNFLRIIVTFAESGFAKKASSESDLIL